MAAISIQLSKLALSTAVLKQNKTKPSKCYKETLMMMADEHEAQSARFSHVGRDKQKTWCFLLFP